MMNTYAHGGGTQITYFRDVSDIEIEIKAEEDTITEKKPKRETRKSKSLIKIDN